MSIQQVIWARLSRSERGRLLRRSRSDIESLLESVRTIVEAVRCEKDAALRRFTREFDGADIESLGIRVADTEFAAARSRLSPTVIDALDYAIGNVRRFHASQVETAMPTVQVRDGIVASERSTPIRSAGLYVPSGRGSFPSMLYMLAVPAVLAGVPRVVVTTPPREDGSVDPAVLYAARACGVTDVFRVGGAQAIAALAYGTETIAPVRKIVGPGSAYVAAARRIVADVTDVGLPAGPSESIVLADVDADAETVALDLMIEAEHGSDSAALLVTESTDLAASVAERIGTLLPSVPEPRRGFLTDVFSGYGGIVVTGSIDESVDVVNDFAPEHLLIHADDPARWRTGSPRRRRSSLDPTPPSASPITRPVQTRYYPPAGGRAHGAPFRFAISGSARRSSR